VLRAGAEEDEPAILRYCADRLPLAKRPKRILFLPELPKSDRGKVLRDRLREQFLQRGLGPLRP
jgi:acyl-CoA synthetase (AMP-forming)/AMP-acid ligase II